MNPFCPSCGHTMRIDEIRAWLVCPNCDKTITALRAYREDAPKLAHGTRCDACDGTGTQELEFTERHPYGDTYAEEQLTEEVDCEECNGKGYFLDERGKSCVICGRDIPDGTGVLIDGWRVHESFECSTDEPPRLDGWDS